MGGSEEHQDVRQVAPSCDTPGTGRSTSEENKKKGVISRIWNGIFRLHDEDYEKRLQHISKEEAVVLARMKNRSLGWRRMERNLVVFSIIFEVIAVVHAIMTTRLLDLNWKMRALRVMPIFLLPGLSFVTYSSLVSFNRMCDRKDQKTLERLQAERKEKIDELKAKTNFYTTQQLIQRYDSDPAAKAAAASVLASKLGVDSGLTLHMEDSPKHNKTPTGMSNDVDFKQSTGLLRKRKQRPRSSSNNGSELLLLDNNNYDGEMLHHYSGSEEEEEEEAEISNHNQLVVEHHVHAGSNANDVGWIPRIAALLVGEDPTESCPLICGNCHMHNGLARKEDFPYTTYYCPHCNALNRPKQQQEKHASSPSSLNLTSSSTMNDVNLHKDDDDDDDKVLPTMAAASAARGKGEEEECGTNVPSHRTTVD